jgi:hypothetical protein
VTKENALKRQNLERQNLEFDALTTLAEHWNKLREVAVVDDDYPEYRRRYEVALQQFIEALKINRRL